MAMFVPLLPKPKNEAERRRAKPLLWACLIGTPLGIAADLTAAFAAHDKLFAHVSDDAFACGVVGGMLVLSVALVGLLFALFFAISESRRRAGDARRSHP